LLSKCLDACSRNPTTEHYYYSTTDVVTASGAVVPAECVECSKEFCLGAFHAECLLSHCSERCWETQPPAECVECMVDSGCWIDDHECLISKCLDPCDFTTDPEVPAEVDVVVP